MQRDLNDQATHHRQREDRDGLQQPGGFSPAQAASYCCDQGLHQDAQADGSTGEGQVDRQRINRERVLLAGLGCAGGRFERQPLSG